jgi:hypothetical protein
MRRQKRSNIESPQSQINNCEEDKLKKEKEDEEKRQRKLEDDKWQAEQRERLKNMGIVPCPSCAGIMRIHRHFK